MPSVIGVYDWGMDMDDEGHRDYTLDLLIDAATDDGPANIMLCPDLPLIGAYWQVIGDLDLQARRIPKSRFKPVVTGEPTDTWLATLNYSTRPIKRCQDSSVEDPLSEPPKFSGDFMTRPRKYHFDKDGKPIRSSSWERLEYEEEIPHPVVRISQNVAVCQYALAAQVMTFAPLNDSPLWGLPARCWRLTGYSVDENFYGTCSRYYTENYEISANYDTWDREVSDEGTRVLKPGGDLDNPEDFVLYRQPGDGGHVRIFLNGAGVPAADEASAAKKKPKVLGETNLLSFGLPATIPPT